jgi:hypothetical protein
MSQNPRLHKIWIEQCDAARTIRLRAAFDYLIGEKLMAFADAATTRPEFKNDLPRFISEVRAIFSMEELAFGSARYQKKLQEDMKDSARDLDDFFVESPKRIKRRAERFAAIEGNDGALTWNKRNLISSRINIPELSILTWS